MSARQCLFHRTPTIGGGGGKVLQATVPVVALAGSYVIKTFAPQTDVWTSVEMAFEPATLNDFITNGYGSGLFTTIEDGSIEGQTFDGTGGYLIVSNPDTIRWQFYVEAAGDGYSYDPAVVDSIWFLMEMHYVENDACYFFINGDQRSIVANGPGTVTQFDLGQLYPGPAAVDDVMYFRNVKIGTTQGASDIFADDFSSNDLSNWTSTTGTCTVVDDPYA